MRGGKLCWVAGLCMWLISDSCCDSIFRLLFLNFYFVCR